MSDANSLTTFIQVLIQNKTCEDKKMFAENFVDVAETIQSATPISITSLWWMAALNIVIVIVFAQSS